MASEFCRDQIQNWQKEIEKKMNNVGIMLEEFEELQTNEFESLPAEFVRQLHELKNNLISLEQWIECEKEWSDIANWLGTVRYRFQMLLQFYSPPEFSKQSSNVTIWIQKIKDELSNMEKGFSKQVDLEKMTRKQLKAEEEESREKKEKISQKLEKEEKERQKREEKRELIQEEEKSVIHKEFVKEEPIITKITPPVVEDDQDDVMDESPYQRIEETTSAPTLTAKLQRLDKLPSSRRKAEIKSLFESKPKFFASLSWEDISSEFWHEILDFYYQKQIWLNAQEVGKIIISNEPESKSRQIIADVYITLGQQDKAREIVAKITPVAETVDMPTGLSVDSAIVDKIISLDRAVNENKRSRAINPTHPRLQIPKERLSELSKIIKELPDHTADELTLAIKGYKVLVYANPYDYKVYMAKAKCHEKLKDINEALKAWESARKLLLARKPTPQSHQDLGTVSAAIRALKG